MQPEILTQFCKSVFALSFAGAAYVAETVVPDIPGVPDWVSSLGLPVAFLVAVIYALVSTNKALRQSEDGRRADWLTFSDKLERIAERDADSRERLIRATDTQTAEFKGLAEQLKSRPCQK